MAHNNNNGIDFSPIMDTVNNLINSVSSAASNLPNMMNRNDDCSSNACPPKQPPCPPSCILTIHEKAMHGERILVPFNIKNTHSTARTYRVGMFPMMDQNGQPAQPQPQLSHGQVMLNPGQSITVTLKIDLANYPTGNRYEADIVVREKDFNQNICFTLDVVGYSNVPTATPWDECDVYRKWNGWQRHFMCPPCKPGGLTATDPNTGVVGETETGRDPGAQQEPSDVAKPPKPTGGGNVVESTLNIP